MIFFLLTHFCTFNFKLKRLMKTLGWWFLQGGPNLRVCLRHLLNPTPLAQTFSPATHCIWLSSQFQFHIFNWIETEVLEVLQTNKSSQRNTEHYICWPKYDLRDNVLEHSHKSFFSEYFDNVACLKMLHRKYFEGCVVFHFADLFSASALYWATNQAPFHPIHLLQL